MLKSNIMKNIIIAIIVLLLHTSCSENNTSQKITDPVNISQKGISDHDRSVDGRVTNILGRNHLSANELLDLYIELSDIDNALVKANSKNIVLNEISISGFLKNANLEQVEYLIKDQSKQYLNLATIGINYRLFNRALDLNSTLDIPQFEKDFRSKNKGKIYEYYNKEDQEMIQYLQQGMFFQMRINLMNKS
jgi:hypothetical protein